MTKREASKLGTEAMRIAVAEKKRLRIEEYNKTPNLCKGCGTPLTYEMRNNDYCSRSCAATSTNSRRGKLSDETRQKISDSVRKNLNLPTTTVGDKICPVCKNRHSKQGKYCSDECYKKHLYEKKTKNWNAKKADIEKTGMFPVEKPNLETDRKIARKYIEEKTGHVCSICGRSKWNGNPIPLVVDHSDGNAMNHQVKNLRLVCPNCDAMLPTFKNRPHKSTRIFRRKRM